MKKILAVLLIFSLLVVPTININAEESTENNVYKEFFVDISIGNDDNNGSESAPFKSIQRAQDEVRKFNKTMTGDIIVNIAPGRYQVDDSVYLDETDSGFNGFEVIYRGTDAKNLPVISGAIQVSGFTPTEGEDGVWQTYLPEVKFVREMFVNDVICQRARTENALFGTGNYQDEDPTYAYDGIYVDKSTIGLYENPEDMELVWPVSWKTIIMHVKDMYQDPKNADQAIIELPNPMWISCRNTNDNPVDHPTDPGYEIGFSVENAYELMDEPGEFYYNKKTQILYYIPREGQDMTTAEVLVPTIDKVLEIKGSDYEDKVHNITMENIEFAHTTWADLDTECHKFNQGEAPIFSARPERSIGGVEVDWADDITIKSCSFYGIKGVGLSLMDSVCNSTFDGNTFADIGCGAVLVGQKWHNKWIDLPEGLDGRAANVFYRKGWVSNCQQKFGTWMIMPATNNEFYGNPSAKWASYPGIENEGVKSWVKGDLEKAYNIESIKVSFVGIENKESRSNFEVLVSNDRYFDEYDVIATVKEPVEDYIEFEIPEGKKYRYFMLRKTKAAPFSISSVWVYSYDRKPMGTAERGLCINNMVSNNYVTRIGQLHRGSPAITGYYPNKLTLDHNVIYDIPYSGISVGWGWSEKSNTTCNDNIISNNWIEDFTLVDNDSGAIYVMGNCPGMKIYGNVCKNQGNKMGALYTDNGAAYMHFWDNLTENTCYPLFVYSQYMYEVKAWDNYMVGTYRSQYKGTNCELETLNTIMPHRFPREAIEIANNAGLMDGYEYVAERVRDNKNNWFKGPYSNYALGRKAQSGEASARIDEYEENIEVLLNSGWVIGDYPWQLSPEHKYQMEYYYDRIRNINKADDNEIHGDIEEQMALASLMKDVYSSVKHLSVEETKAICDNLLSNAKEEKVFGGYMSGAIGEFKKAVESAMELPENDENDIYMKVTALEAAIDVFSQKQYSDDVKYVYVQDGKTVMDKENRKIVVTIPNGIDTSKLNVQVLTHGATKVATDLNRITFNSEIVLPVYNSEIGKYGYWTLELKQDDFSRTTNEITINPDDWSNTNPNVAFQNVAGTHTFQAWVHPYMFKTPVFGKVSFNIEANRYDNNDGLSFVMSAKACEDIEYDGLYYKNTYYKVSIKNQNIELYQIKSGEATLIDAGTNIGFIYGEPNKIELEVKEDGAYDIVEVSLNDKAVLNSAAKTIGAKGYFGIYTKEVPIKVIPLK